MAPRKQFNSLLIEEKLKVIKFAESHTHRETSVEFNISKTAVQYIVAHKKKYLEHFEERLNMNRHRKVRESIFSTVNDRTKEWAWKMMENGELITRKLIKEKARSYAHDEGITSFSASNGWLMSFIQRYGIRLSNRETEASAHVNNSSCTSAESLPERQVKRKLSCKTKKELDGIRKKKDENSMFDKSNMKLENVPLLKDENSIIDNSDIKLGNAPQVKDEKKVYSYFKKLEYYRPAQVKSFAPVVKKETFSNVNLDLII